MIDLYGAVYNIYHAFYEIQNLRNVGPPQAAKRLAGESSFNKPSTPILMLCNFAGIERCALAHDLLFSLLGWGHFDTFFYS